MTSRRRQRDSIYRFLHTQWSARSSQGKVPASQTQLGRTNGLHMSMLGFVYLVLILGWILIVLFLKCKKSLAAPFRFGENYTDAIADTERRPSVHVIQLQHDDVEREDHYLDNFHRNTENLQRYSHRSQRSTLEERTIERTYPTDAVINPAYMHDEDYVINAPPPSYEEVMRQPQVYPQVRHNNHKISDADI
ncbi:uncharacterized protein LOC108094844 [Drosophila ficusphila]|uniref:uncharacterized protein LOC108094844 n=1 Tax=Drosophila ficusphila TaxID=30025 RepID=UPI001C897ADA|nr:uncharacterized protein LOC108094844 [Drosophila ficusphila]